MQNALKYCDRQPEINISSVKKDKKEWVISVKDNGMGFNMVYKDKNFVESEIGKGSELSFIIPILKKMS